MVVFCEPGGSRQQPQRPEQHGGSLPDGSNRNPCPAAHDVSLHAPQGCTPTLPLPTSEEQQTKAIIAPPPTTPVLSGRTQGTPKSRNGITEAFRHVGGVAGEESKTVLTAVTPMPVVKNIGQDVAVLSRAEFESATRDALRRLHQIGKFAGNPLQAPTWWGRGSSASRRCSRSPPLSSSPVLSNQAQINPYERLARRRAPTHC